MLDTSRVIIFSYNTIYPIFFKYINFSQNFKNGLLAKLHQSPFWGADFFYTRTVGIKAKKRSFFHRYKKKLHMVRTKKLFKYFLKNLKKKFSGKFRKSTF
tara:strand:- start:1565 stop:1864 length:300 start_codon:yes stop_codon:yes gene_type:complete